MPSWSQHFARLFPQTRTRRGVSRPKAAMIAPHHKTEKLDDRVMLAGNVTAELLAGGTTLRITGDAQSNEIFIDFSVEAGGASTIFVGQFDIDTAINGSIDNFELPAAGITTIRIDMGDGDDLVDSLVNSDGTAWSTGFGDLDILLIDMQGGEDTLSFDGSDLDDNGFSGIATIQGGTENDTMDVIGWEFGGDVRFRGIGGDDTMRLEDVSIGGTLRARTNSGEDRLLLSRVQIDGETRIAGGGGELITEITNLNSTGNVTVRGQDGMDYVSIQDSATAGTLTVSTFAEDDLIRLQRVAVAGQTTIVAGDGNDHVYLNGGTNANGEPSFLVFGSRLFVDGGIGDDNVIMSIEPGRTFFGGDAIFRGEDGSDAFFANGALEVPFGREVINSFDLDDGMVSDPRLDALVAAFSSELSHTVAADAFRNPSMVIV